MIKVIGSKNKVAFFSLFGFKVVFLAKGQEIDEEIQPIIEEGDKVLIVDEEFYETLSQFLERYRPKTFPLVFSLRRPKGKGLLEKLLE